VRELVRVMEQAVIDLLAEFGVAAQGREDAPGVYVGDAKIASLGLKIKNGYCYHGLAFNVDMDLSPFANINPCGHAGLRVTQCCELGITAGIEELQAQLAQNLIHGYSNIWKESNMSNPEHKQTGATSRQTGKERPRVTRSRSCRCSSGCATGMDTREVRQRAGLSRREAHTARAPVAYGVRGSLLPEHRRVFRQGHGVFHDTRRCVHAPLPVLRRGARQAASTRRE
jgi:hypothetical protein